MAHVRARVDPAEAETARRILHDEGWRLFAAMPVADRRHALDVVARLAAAGHRDPDLLAAALLHDVAKGRRMRLWHRVVGVLLEAVSPRLVERVARDDPGSWRYPFHLYLYHGSLSARLAEGAGCAPRTVAFMRGSVDGTDAQLLRALRAADDAS